jgi:DNA-binding Xre family transcriptional regulator
MSNGKQVNIEHVHDELQIANRLMILSLVRRGIQQKDLAATIGISESGMSKMFPQGLLKRVAKLSKIALDGTDD